MSRSRLKRSVPALHGSKAGRSSPAGPARPAPLPGAATSPDLLPPAGRGGRLTWRGRAAWVTGPRRAFSPAPAPRPFCPSAGRGRGAQDGRTGRVPPARAGVPGPVRERFVARPPARSGGAPRSTDAQPAPRPGHVPAAEPAANKGAWGAGQPRTSGPATVTKRLCRRAPPAAGPRAGTRGRAPALLTKAAARGVRTHRNMSTH